VGGDAGHGSAASCFLSEDRARGIAPAFEYCRCLAGQEQNFSRPEVQGDPPPPLRPLPYDLCQLAAPAPSDAARSNCIARVQSPRDVALPFLIKGRAGQSLTSPSGTPEAESDKSLCDPARPLESAEMLARHRGLTELRRPGGRWMPQPAQGCSWVPVCSCWPWRGSNSPRAGGVPGGPSCALAEAHPCSLWQQLSLPGHPCSPVTLDKGARLTTCCYEDDLFGRCACVAGSTWQKHLHMARLLNPHLYSRSGNTGSGPPGFASMILPLTCSSNGTPQHPGCRCRQSQKQRHPLPTPRVLSVMPAAA